MTFAESAAETNRRCRALWENGLGPKGEVLKHYVIHRETKGSAIDLCLSTRKRDIETATHFRASGLNNAVKY